ncbi:MAG: putative O-glycosylation ligase, exosortase A system-associated [Sphingomonadaceae bacterium]|nr:putative O-glycosylation ligase, exosortase A system-associated [Sphingomonadaceae bacterium]
MLDLALILFILAVLALGIRRPFIWVLAYLYIDILAPQKIGWAITAAIPVSLIAFCAAFAGYLAADSKKGSRFTLRQGILVVLLCYCAWTTSHAEFAEEALVKWDWVWKALVFAIFLPLTLRTKVRIEAALLIMVLTAATIITNAGIKTVFGGGGYGTLHIYVNDNSGMYESSTLATVAIAIIPLIVWLVKFGTIFPDDWRVRLYSAALIFSCLLIPVGTEARTGLVCIAVLAILLLRDVKRRLTFIVAGAALGMMALPFLPQSYYERMSTISGHQSDESASTRVAVWKWTLDYASRNPMGGGFEIYRGNKFEFKMPVAVKDGNTTAVEYQDVIDQGRAFHSAIFEMLGEQGWPGLFLWLWLHAAGLWQMERLRHRFGRREGGPHWQGQLASALQNAQIIYLVGSLFQGIAYQPFVLMLIGLQCALWSYCKRLDSPIGKRRPGMMSAPAIEQSSNAVTAPGGALR